MAFKNIHIIFNPHTGKMQQLRLNASGGNATYDSWDQGQSLDGGETPQTILWEGASSLELVTGSDCVVIAGKKFCA